MSSYESPEWLMARPIAHRGLHDRAAGVIENTIEAALAAIAHGFAIECDVQLSSDGQAMVFHDDRLDRLTTASGAVIDHTSAQLQAIPFKVGSGRILPLDKFLALIAGRVPLICEIKSRFDGDMRLTRRTAMVALAQSGPVAFKSFDPAVIADLRMSGTKLPLGIVSQANFTDHAWDLMPANMKSRLINFLHFPETQPDFLSWHVGDLPNAIPFLLRSALHRPVMAWTVRTPAQHTLAKTFADQIVFEGFVP